MRMKKSIPHLTLAGNFFFTSTPFKERRRARVRGKKTLFGKKWMEGTPKNVVVGSSPSSFARHWSGVPNNKKGTEKAI